MKIWITAMAIGAAALSSCVGGGSTQSETADSTALDGYIVLFDGETFEGWRGYNKDTIPGAWTIEDGCIKINGSGSGEAGANNGGDLLFEQQFGNFEFDFEWKVDKASNSGVFYLVQEIEDTPSYYSAPEYQVLDNENHVDARLGVDGNRQSASLYDLVAAKPQNSKPYGEWNTGKIIVQKGTVLHFQNGELVVEYHLWTPEWNEMIANSKFAEDKIPQAYELLLNCGGENKEGYIVLQDHGDNTWFRNLRIKELD